jgi:pre-rRNA-processing protein TSR3
MADIHISRADRDIISQLGLAVIDCSWAELKATKFGRIRARNTRLLPFMIATNPVKYGSPFTLSCAEALAAALVITGFTPYAQMIMSQFSWGVHFLPMNELALSLSCVIYFISNLFVVTGKRLGGIKDVWMVQM